MRECIDGGYVRHLQRRSSLLVSTINEGVWNSTDVHSRVDKEVLAAYVIFYEYDAGLRLANAAGRN